jgi:hypothetical protein
MPGKVIINIEGQDNVSAKLAAIRKEFDTLSTSKGWQSVMMGMGVGVGMAAFHAVETGIRDVVNIIPDMISKGQAFAETVHTISETTGASAEASSRLAGMFQFLGIGTDNLGGKFRILANDITGKADQMKAWGIATTDASGATLDMVTIVDNARSALSQYGAGAEKAAIVTKLFGRSGLDLLEYLNLTDAQIASLSAEMDKLGVTMDESGVMKAKNVSREFELFGLSVQGIANKLLSDIAPALTSAVDAFASFVSDNGRQIAQFAADVANFVLGMVSAITGASLSANTFTSSLAALGTVGATPAQTKIASLKAELTALDSKQKTAGGSNKALTDALHKQTEEIDKQLQKLKDLGAEQDKQFSKEMARLGLQVTAQADAIGAGEKAAQISDQQAGMTKDLAAAYDELAKAQAGSSTAAGDYAVSMMQAQDALTKALAGSTDTKTGAVTVDTTAVAAAQQRIVDLQASQADAATSQADSVKAAQDRISGIQKQQADLGTQISNDARRSELDKVTAFLDSLTTAEKDTTDKKKLLTQEKAQAATLASQIATAKEKGDLQSVSDLTLMLQGVQAVERRTAQAIKEGEAQTALEKRKADLAAETAAVGSAAVDQTAIRKAEITKQIADLEKQDNADAAARKAESDRMIALGRDMDKNLGDNPTGAVGLFTAATAAGEDFAAKIKLAFDGLSTSIGKTVDIIGSVARVVSSIDKNVLGLGLIALGVATGNLPAALAGIAMESANILNAKPTNDARGNAGPGSGSRVPPSGVGSGGGSGGGSWVPVPSSYTPAGATNSLTVAPGAIVINGGADSASAIADATLLAFKRETQRQGMTL